MKMMLSSEIFSLRTVERALNDYRHLLTATAKCCGGYIEIVFLRCKYDEVRTARELENYMIQIENS